MQRSQFWYYTDWHQWANQQTYSEPADPDTLLSVAPSTVGYYNNELRLNWGLGRVQAGEWDRTSNCRVFRETPLYRGLKQRFVDKCDWEATDLYQRAKERFGANKTVRGYDTLESFRKVRCEYIDDLYHSIRDDGYQPNKAAGHRKATDDNQFENAYANHLDPLVVIARTGDIYWTEGYHRLAIASLLDIETVPVHVLARHEEWQQNRDRIHAASNPQESSELKQYLEHPDIELTPPE